MIRNGKDIQVNVIEKWMWTTANETSLLFAQRPFAPNHVATIKDAKWHGIPVVADYDDDLWNLPFGNPAFLQYTEEWLQGATESAMLSDVVITSTEPLAERIRSFGHKDVRVIKNALHDYYKWTERPQNKVVLWRGGPFHEHDLDTVADDLIRVVNANPDWHWFFAGSVPSRIVGKFTHKNWSGSPVIEIEQFHRALVQMAPAIIINPLEMHPFNECKSNIGWIEATMCGATILVPDFPQFDEPNTVRYKEGEFGDKLQSMLNGNLGDVRAARARIDSHYRLHNANQKRLEIFKELFKR
jgi:hypothetical protein